MPIVLDGGVDEVEDPTSLEPNILQRGQGAEYRKGRRGIHVAKGRKLLGDAGAVTWKGCYYAGFEGGDENQFLILHAGDTLYSDAIGDGMTPSSLESLSAGSTPVVGAHYANRHYLALGNANKCVELDSILTLRDVGMRATGLVCGVSVTQGSGDMTTTTGLTYWLTEYDSIRGLESIAGNTAFTDVFTAIDSVIVTIGGTILNDNTDRIRIYRTTDGGTYPDGGMIAEASITTTSHADTDSIVETLGTPLYGFITIGGLDFERDVQPEPLKVISGPFQNSMIGFLAGNPREIAFSADGRPESWPDAYRIPIQTHRQDIGMCFVELNGMYGVFTKDSVHRLTRLPREIDSAFAGGEAASVVTNERGAVSSKAAIAFTMPGRGPIIMFACRDGIWITNLVTFMIPVTDGVDWEGRVDGDKLDQLELVNNSHERRVICYYRKSNNGHGVMYLDYQRDAIRITHPDHGAIRTATEGPYKGFLRVLTGDARTENGQVYVEGTQDRDDSEFTTSSGAISFSIRTAEVFPAGVKEKQRLGRATWMHDAGVASATQRFYANREAVPATRTMNFSEREATEAGLELEVNSFSLQLESVGTVSYGIHWLDIEGFESARLSGQGA